MWMLLHGFTGSPESWERVLDQRELRAPVLVPHLLGHGPNWRRDERHTFVDEVDRLADLAEGMETPRFLAAYSLGARVGLVLLSRHPQLFAGAVLIGARPGLVDPIEQETRRLADAKRAARLRRDGLHAFLDSWEKQRLFDTQRSLTHEVLAVQRAVRESHDAEGLARSLEVLGLASMPADAPKLGSAGVTLMTGEEDEKFSDIAASLAEQIEGFRVVRVADVGHNLLLEAPSEVAAEMALAESRVPATERV